MPLTDTAIRAAKPQGKPVKLSDGGGLQLLIAPTGGKLWRLAYRFDGKQKQLALGAYPTIGLADARKRREDAKALLAEGMDPGEAKKAAKAVLLASEAANANTFGIIADEFIAKIEAEGRAKATMEKARWLLGDVSADLRNRLISEITPPQVLEVCRAFEAKGNYEAARRLRSTIGRVFRYAIATGRTERDVTADLRGALIAPQVEHRAAITDEEGLGKLMAAIYGWKKG